MVDRARNLNASANTLIPRAVLRTVLNSNYLNVCHINVQSLTARKLSKFYELKMNLENSKLDIICMSETWLDETINNRMIAIEGYKIYRHDRNRHGGGICVYARNELSCRVIESSARSNTGDFISKTEYMCLEVLCGNERFLLAVYYNPPEVDCSEVLLNHFDEFTVRYESIFFIGDFNTDLLKVNSRQQRFKDVISCMSYVC